MTTYNPNDFYPRSGAAIDSQGNVRNTADGFNGDGSETVQIEGTNGNKLSPNVDGSENVVIESGSVTITNGGSNLAMVLSPNNNDNVANNTYYGIFTNSAQQIYNGTTWDRLRGIPGSKGILATVYSGMQSLAITTATTTAVKASAGVIGTIINAGSSTSGTITVYDNTSATGKIIWSGTLTTGQVLPLGIPCGTGITIVTAAANTITVSYA